MAASCSNVRVYFDLFNGLMNQQNDPFRRKCKALVNTTKTARESPTKFEREYASEMQGLAVIFQHLYAKTAFSDT